MPPTTEQLNQLSTGLQGLNDSLSKLAQNAGVAQPTVTPSLELDQIRQAATVQPPVIPENRSSQAILNEFRRLPSAIGDDTKVAQTEDELTRLVQDLRGRSSFQTQETERFQIPELEAQIRDIGADISKKRAALTAELETLGQQGFRATAVRGQEARARRQVAAEIQGLEAAQQAALGNLQTAQSAVERSVQSKYGPILEEIDIQKQLLEIRKETMTRDQQKRAEERETELTILQNQLNQAQQQEQTALSQIATAVGNGFDPRQAAQLTQGVIRGEIDPASVLAQVGGFQVDPLDRALKQLSIEGKSISNEEARIKLNQLKNPPVGQVDPQTLEMIRDLSDGQRSDLVAATQTVTQLDELQRIIEEVGNPALLNSSTEEGRRFRRIAADIADKLARERTGAVVSSDETKQFKTILGIGFGQRLLSDKQELLNSLDEFKNKHERTTTLIDPTGRIRNYLDATAPEPTPSPKTASGYVSNLKQEIQSGTSIYQTYINQSR